MPAALPAILAFDTSTERLALGLLAHGRSWVRDLPGGAQASATLLPAVRALLAEAGTSLAGLDAIAFGRGPGSFTGLRTACAVAQGLAYGARAGLPGAAALPLLPVDTLLAVAEDARHRTGATHVVAALDARMDEVYWAHWRHADGQWQPAGGDFGLCAPEAVPVPEGWLVAGTAPAAYAARLPAGPQCDARPDAGALLRLAPTLLAAGCGVAAADALPHYVRDKVAQTTAERVLRAAAAAAVAAGVGA